MSLNPVMLFDLKPIEPNGVHRIMGLETITVTKSKLLLSKKMMEKLGNPEKVEFAIDAEKNLFGIRAAAPESKFCFLIHRNKSNGYLSGTYVPNLINGERKINMNSRNMVLSEPWFDSGYFLFDIDKAYVKKVEKRSK